jgi:hypothetical protein
VFSDTEHKSQQEPYEHERPDSTPELCGSKRTPLPGKHSTLVDIVPRIVITIASKSMGKRASKFWFIIRASFSFASEARCHSIVILIIMKNMKALRIWRRCLAFRIPGFAILYCVQVMRSPIPYHYNLELGPFKWFRANRRDSAVCCGDKHARRWTRTLSAVHFVHRTQTAQRMQVFMQARCR